MAGWSLRTVASFRTLRCKCNNSASRVLLQRTVLQRVNGAGGGGGATPTPFTPGPADAPGLLPGKLLGDGPALGSFDGSEVVIDEEDLGVVRRDEQGGGKRGGADHEGQVAGLEAAHRAHERAIRFEAPVRRGALRRAQRSMLLAPARERGQSQAPDDDAIDVLEQQHFGEEVLPCGALLELAYRLVADLQQVRSCECVLVLLDALQQELLVLLLERARRPPRGPGALLPRAAQQ